MGEQQGVHAETPRQSASCGPQKSASFSAAKVHAETSRFRHGTMVLATLPNTGADDGQGEAGAIYLRVSTGEQPVDNQRRAACPSDRTNP